MRYFHLFEKFYPIIDIVLRLIEIWMQLSGL